jgi:poly(A) polymerase
MCKAILYQAMWIRTVNLFPADSNSKQPISLAIQDLLERQTVSRLLSALNANNEQARIVGGAVRDTIMGRAIGDIDIATTALPETVVQLAKENGWRAIPTGIEHGTITLVIDGVAYEVTTLRRDVETDGRRAVVAFSRDFKEDAFRRDFTMNALSLSQNGVIHDYATGLSDAATGLVRFMGNPETRICEDYLRILRFFRFQATHGQHGLEFDQSTADFQACALHSGELKQLSRERIRQEILKLLDAPHCMTAVRAMETIGIWDILLPSIQKGFAALEHLVVLHKATGIKPDIIVRLAAFCGPTLNAASLQKLLVLSNREHKRILTAETLVHEMTTLPLTENILKKTAFLGGKEGCTDALLLKSARIGASPETTAKQLAQLEQTLVAFPVNPFTSDDVARHGVNPGPLMGRVLKKSLELWLNSGLPDDATAQKRILEKAVKVTTHDGVH